MSSFASRQPRTRNLDVSDKQVTMLRDLAADDDGSAYKCCLEQATYTSLERRGLVSYGRKDTVVITRQGRNVLTGVGFSR